MTNFDSWHQSSHLAFCTWDAIFHNSNVSATGGKTLKSQQHDSEFDYITCMDIFSFHSPALVHEPHYIKTVYMSCVHTVLSS
jgi:hypothetical protein